MVRFSHLLAAGAALALTAGVAQASTITTSTQTVTFGPGATDYTNNTGNGTFQLFNTTLGTLDSVTISGTYGFTSTLTITNNGTSASSGTARTESASAFGSSTTSINSIIQALLDTQGSVTVGGNTLNPAAFDSLGTQASYSLAAGGSTTANSNRTTQTDGPQTDTTASDLAAFSKAGGGTFAALFNTITGTTISNTGGNTAASQVTTATGTISLFYTYDTPVVVPVPEPASMALLGASLVGLGMFRRKK